MGFGDDGPADGRSEPVFLSVQAGRPYPPGHLLCRINSIVTRVLAELREKLEPFYRETGRPSIDPELMLRMLIVSYCYGLRSERGLCEEVELHLAYWWFCRLDLADKVPDHSTFSVNRHGRFRDSDIFRQLFGAVVRACMDAGLVKGEGFAVDASVIEADASRYHGKAPDEIVWSDPKRQTRAVTVRHRMSPLRAGCEGPDTSSAPELRTRNNAECPTSKPTRQTFQARAMPGANRLLQHHRPITATRLAQKALEL
jgi:transposase